jgi:hypothetical protein
MLKHETNMKMKSPWILPEADGSIVILNLLNISWWILSEGDGSIVIP